MLREVRERRERAERAERTGRRITTVGEMMDAFSVQAVEAREQLIQDRVREMGVPLTRLEGEVRPGTGTSAASASAGSANGSTTSTKSKGKGKEKAKAVLAKVQQTISQGVRRGSEDSDTSFWACDGSAEDLNTPVAAKPMGARCGVCGVSISASLQAQGVLLCAGCAHGVDGYENNLPVREDSLRPATSPLEAPPPAVWMQSEPVGRRANRSSSFYSVRPGVQPLANAGGGGRADEMTYSTIGRLANPYANPYDNGINLSELTVFNSDGWLETGSQKSKQRREQEVQQSVVREDRGRSEGRDTGFYRFYDELLVASPVTK